MLDLLSNVKTTIALRDLSALSREKTIVLAILIQLFIAAFSSFLVVGLTSLYDPSAIESGNTGLDIGISGEYQDRLEAAAEEAGGVSTVAFEDANTALAAFDDGEVAAVLDSSRIETDDGSRVDITATVPAEDLRTTVIIVQIRSILTELERTERTDRADYLDFQPRPLPDEDGSSPFFGFTYTILLPLLLFLPPFISGSVVVDALTEEIERGTLELLRVAPVSMTDIVDGKSIAMILLAPLQAVLWLFLLQINGITIDNILWLLLFVTAIATITTVVGVLLGLITRRRRKAQLLYSMLVILLFGLSALLPEHPASTVALLSVDSATSTTRLHVVGFALLAVGLYAIARQYVRRIDPESL
ncbi:ABC transporter permease [Halovenus marina]|uniref:ABC transporter permease n=1 Tax=Halovenus marina TaxID=3396621 RepID=UPI003F55E4CA